MTFFNSPAQTLFLELSRAQGDLNQQRQDVWATPAMAQALAEYSTLYPQGSSALGIAFAQGGVPAASQIANQLVMEEQQVRPNQGPIEKEGEGFWDDLSGVWNEVVMEPLKGTTRWTMSAWDAAYNMVAGGAPIRALALSRQEDIPFAEAWKEQDPYFFEALGGLVAGERVNLGSGWLPSSDVADDVQVSVNDQMQQIERETQGLPTNERYTTRLEAAPDVWRNAVTASAEQAAMGRPLTELARTSAESVIFEVPRLGGGTSYTPWSPGRIGASTVWEPGTRGFQYASGTGDFLSQMFADPADYLGLWWAKAGRAGRLLKAESEAAALATTTMWDEGGKLIGPVIPKLDETRATARALKIPDEVVAGPSPRPQWVSGTEKVNEPIGAFDPPRWYLDKLEQLRGAARNRLGGGTGTPRWRSKGAGNYRMELLDSNAEIAVRRVGTGKDAYWDVLTPEGKLHRTPVEVDPRFTPVETPGFRTLKEAKEAATDYATGKAENLNHAGVTPDEFAASGESFYIQDGVKWVKDQVTIGPSPNESMTNLRRVYRNKPLDDNNTKIVVFGRTADVADRKVAGKPEGLIDALRRDRKIRGDNIAGNPNVDSFTNTRRWMEENGYGKLDLGDGDVLIAEKYVGGDPANAMNRIFTEAPDAPLRSIRLSDDLETIDSVSAAELNDVIEWFARSGEKPPDVIDINVARQVREAKLRETPPPELGGVRVDYDAEQSINTLKGKRADLFVKRLFATTREGGQTNRAAMDKLLSFMHSQNIQIPLEYRKALFEAPSEEAVRAVFARMMVEQTGGQLLLPGKQYGRIAATFDLGGDMEKVRWTDKPFFARRAAKMLPHRGVNMIEEPDKAYAIMEQILPNYNVRRGQEFITESGEVLRVEDAFDKLMNLPSGNLDEAYNVMHDFARIFFQSLTNEGVTPDLARRATNYFEEMRGMREFNTARVGNQALKNGPIDGMIVDDVLMGGLDGPQITSQAWDGVMHFPDAHTVKVIANQTDALGRFANTITHRITKGDEFGELAKIERRAWNLFLTNTMNRMWKPFVLLRGAWTLRILLDDQLRIAADGYGMFNHPIRVLNYALTQSKDWRTAFTRGHVDVFGTRMALDNVNDLVHGDLLRAAAMKHGDPRIGSGSFGYKHRSAYPKSAPEYAKGHATEIRMLRADPITSALAGADPSEDAVHVVTQYLMGKGDRATRQSWLDNRTRLATFNRRMDPEISRKILEGDYETIYKIVSHQDAMLRQTVGGRVVLDDGVGAVRDYTNFTKVDDIPSDMKGTPRWRVIDAGDRELLDVVAKRGHSIDTDDAMRELQSLIRRKIDETPDRYPQFAMVSDINRASDTRTLKQDYDKAISFFYEWAMTRPSDKYSRIPTFRKAYWDKMGQLSVGMTDAGRANVLARAKAANAISEFELGVKKVGKVDVTFRFDDLEQADYMAKAYGLTQVDKTLFDLVNKRNISDSLNLIFPFVEAWGEFISRWGRFMVTGDKNMANMRRLQQGIEGLREDSGFFHPNEFGQEVFAYPAFLKKGHIAVHNTLNNIPFLGGVMGGDIDPALAETIDFQGNAESLNFASGFIPGFGPVFQMAAKAIPDDPGFDFLRDIVAPFGTEGTISPLMPAWVKRVVSAWGGAQDPTLQYTWNSTVQDVIRTMMDEGAFAGVTAPEEIDKLVEEAKEKARGLLMVRAAATFWLPASPSMQWSKKDVDGNIWSYSNLGEEYRKIQNELGGSEAAAFDEFYRRFGSLPAPFTRGDTYAVVDRSLTREGSTFERGNPELFARYPLSAMYLDPSIGAEGHYDHAAMLDQLKRSEREQWTPEQMVYLQQDQYGDLMWDNIQQRALAIPKGEARNAALAQAREEVSTLYPYWNKSIPGKREGARNEEQMAEVIAWTRDPQLMGTPVVQAVRAYLTQRDEVLQAIAQNTTSTTIGGGKSPVSQLGRQWLRDEAEIIMQNHPEFENVFRSVFASEVDESKDALPEILPETTNAWDEGDILESVFGGM